VFNSKVGTKKNLTKLCSSKTN